MQPLLVAGGAGARRGAGRVGQAAGVRRVVHGAAAAAVLAARAGVEAVVGRRALPRIRVAQALGAGPRHALGD